MLAEFIFSKIQREKLMRWSEYLTEKLAVGKRTSEERRPAWPFSVTLAFGQSRFRFLLLSDNGRSHTAATNKRVRAHSKRNRLFIMITLIRALLDAGSAKKKPMSQGWQYFLRCRVLWLGEVNFFSLFEINYKLTNV